MHSTITKGPHWKTGSRSLGGSEGTYFSCGIGDSLQTGPEKVGRKVFEESQFVTKRTRTKFVHEGRYVAEVEVDLIESADGWSPYLSLEDAYRLDDVRDALRRGDLGSAARFGRIYEMRPVASQ